MQLQAVLPENGLAAAAGLAGASAAQAAWPPEIGPLPGSLLLLLPPPPMLPMSPRTTEANSADATRAVRRERQISERVKMSE